MCGIVGVAGNLQLAHEKALRTMLVLDSLRGEDSTGIAAIGKFKDPEVKIAKQVGDPFQLFDDKKFDAALRLPSRAIIGHNRYATVGGVSRQTAHPFENDTLVGVHNGTLKNKHVLADANKFKVDSENLYHHIDKFGLRDALNIIDGAWALVWWNKEEKTLNLLRNEERPLYWCVSVDVNKKPDNQCFFFASEAWMLSIALSRHNIAYSEILPLQKDVHVKISIDDGGILGKPIQHPAEGTYKPPFVHGYGQTGTIYGTSKPNNVVPLNGRIDSSNTTVATSAVKKEEPIAKADVKKSVSDSSKSSGSVCHFDRHYLKAKAVLLETLVDLTDENGVEYISLFDPRNQYYDIRLYPETLEDPVWQMIGSDIQADISVYVPGETPGRGYYKVRPNNFRILADYAPKEKEVETHAGASGKQMDIIEWQRAYPTCAWCTSPLEFGQAKFSTASEAFCPDCAKLEDVIEFAKF